MSDLDQRILAATPWSEDGRVKYRLPAVTQDERNEIVTALRDVALLREELEKVSSACVVVVQERDALQKQCEARAIAMRNHADKIETEQAHRLREQLEKANACLRQIIEADDEFRMSLPDDWEGDPLSDAVMAAKYLIAHTDEKG